MFKSAVIKILGFLALAFFVRRRKIDAGDLKTMLVNRADRLGDAIISLPLLLELSRRFEVTVLTSQYNDFLLRGFFKTQVIVDKPPTVSGFIKKIFANLFSFGYLQKSNTPPRYDIYLDLIGIKGLSTFLRVRKENLCRYYIGFNMSVWSRLLDYSYRSAVELSKTNVTTAAQRLLKESLHLTVDIPDHVDLTSKMIPPAEFKAVPPYILVNIAGFDKFRGPSPQMYARLVDSLKFEGTVVIMDELNRPNIDGFKRAVQRKNIVYLERDYSIWELLYISKHALLYVGSNSGITNILQVPAHCVIFFATTTTTVWNPYSRNLYLKKKTGRTTVEETTTSAGLVKKIIYRPVWCRPCYDIGCRGYRCIKDMDMEAVASEINSFLTSGNH
jgi:ADP-heptose:LPS heptosyltransferase